MRGLKLNFKDGGAVIDFDSVGDQYSLTQQRAVVTFACSTKSDKIFPEKGSDILRKGVTNVIYDASSARREAAFISLDIFNFTKANNDVPLTDPLTKLAFVPLLEGLQFLSLTTTTEFASGTVLSSESDLSL